VAMGVIIGGSLMGALAIVITGKVSLQSTASLAGRLKLWAMVAAMGGTFGALENLETGILHWQLRLVAKQLLLILSAFAGAHLGYLIVASISEGGA